MTSDYRGAMSQSDAVQYATLALVSISAVCSFTVIIQVLRSRSRR